MARAQVVVAGVFALLSGLLVFPACSSTADAGPTCANGTKDGDEVGTDCGGSCETKCTGDACTADGECASAKCETNTCAAPAGKPCGVGTSTPACLDGQPCELNKDCSSLFCEQGACKAPPAGAPGPTDGIKNNGETDVDCGGPNAPACANGKACTSNDDCKDKYCPEDKKLCLEPRNDDGVQNGTETDIDCGGTSGKKCGEARTCVVDTDCFGACNYLKKCVDAASCKPHLGGDTCGPGEVGVVGAAHESCCKTLPVTGYADPKNPGKTVYLDKYEITAGRVRAFIEDMTAKNAGKPNVKAWVTANPPAIWDPTWNAFLPSDVASDVITVPHDPTRNTEPAPWNRNVGTDFQFNGVLFAYVHGHNCINSANAYGFPTFWLPPEVMTKNGGLPRANAFDGAGVMIPAKDYLDVKSATCVTNAMLAAFCAWDGGQLATDEVLDFVTATPASLGNRQGCGTQAGGTLTGGRCAPVADIQATTDSGITPATIKYFFPYFADGTTHEGTSRIAAPGRVTGDVVRIDAADEPWMDLHGNLEEAVLDMTGADFTGNFGLKYRGIGYNSSRAQANPTALTYPEYKAAYTGGRCMRFK